MKFHREYLKYWWQQKMNFALHFFFICTRGKSASRMREISSAQGFFNFSPRIHSSCANKFLFKDEEYSWHFISKRFVMNGREKICIAQEKKRITSKWCWNEKMRKSTSLKGFMRLHQLLKKPFKDFNLSKVDRNF